MADKKQCITTIVIVVGILLAITIGLIVGAFESVEILKFGILVDSAKISVINDDSYLYLSGRYHAGLGNNFYTLPAKRVTLVLSDDTSVQASADYYENSITTRTKEGIPLTTTVSSQIRLIDIKILSEGSVAEKQEYNKKFRRTLRLLNLFDPNTYKPILMAILKSTLLDTLATFNLADIYVKR